MEWYAPLTILPAIGLIILSTVNFLISLNSEIYQLEMDMNRNEEIIRAKLKQLKRLGVANALLYASAVFFMFSALSQAFTTVESSGRILMIVAALFVTVAIGILLTHSIKAIAIRQKNLRL